MCINILDENIQTKEVVDGTELAKYNINDSDATKNIQTKTFDNMYIHSNIRHFLRILLANGRDFVDADRSQNVLHDGHRPATSVDVREGDSAGFGPMDPIGNRDIHAVCHGTVAAVGSPGFTLIELVTVIAILGVMTQIAFSKVTRIHDKALIAVEQSVVACVRTGLTTFAMGAIVGVIDTTNNDYGGVTRRGYPILLEPEPVSDGDAGPDNPFFTVVLAQGGVTDPGWSRYGDVYFSPNGNQYTYDSVVGKFTTTSVVSVGGPPGPAGAGPPGPTGGGPTGATGVGPPGGGGGSPGPSSGGGPLGGGGGPPGQNGNGPPGPNGNGPPGGGGPP